MKLKPGQEYIWCPICGVKMPWYYQLCDRCRYALLAVRLTFDKEKGNTMSEEQIEQELERYDLND